MQIQYYNFKEINIDNDIVPRWRHFYEVFWRFKIEKKKINFMGGIFKCMKKHRYHK